MKFKEMTHQVSCLKTKSNATKCAETLDQARAVPIFFFCLFVYSRGNFSPNFVPTKCVNGKGKEGRTPPKTTTQAIAQDQAFQPDMNSACQ